MKANRLAFLLICFVATWLAACPSSSPPGISGYDPGPNGDVVSETGAGDASPEAGAPCTTWAECDDHDPCTQDFCSQGRCVYLPASGPGCACTASCDDGDPCTVDACDVTAGACTHKALNCDDGDKCTADQCVAGIGCVHSYDSAACGCCKDDATCNDGNACTTEHCGDCACVTVPTDCDDRDPCTTDSCTSASGCTHKTIVGCGAVGCKVDAECTGATACSDAVCLLKDGVGTCVLVPKTDGAPCDDGSACTQNDACAAGHCVGTLTSCDDHDACTSDSCVAATGCAHAPIPACGGKCTSAADCDDADACTKDACAADGICQHTTVSCPWGNDHCQVPFCDSTQGCLYKTDPSCTGGCKSAADCNDNNPCTQDLCDAATGQCAHPATACDDGDACTKDYCDATMGGCVHVKLDHCVPVPCQVDADCGGSGDPCAVAKCVGGSCLTTSYSCDDGNPCTYDKCDGTGGCYHDAVPGCGAVCKTDAECQGPVSNPCTLGYCGNGQCYYKTYTCDDGNPCTSDQCDGKGGCYYYNVPNCAPVCKSNQDCNDGNACTTDACSASGQCVHGPVACPPSTDVCVKTYCDPTVGCTSVQDPNCASVCHADSQCDDGNVCTKDACQNGACIHYANPGCCTSDADCPATPDCCVKSYCDPTVRQCVTSTSSCDDGNPCTTDACKCSSAGAMCFHTAVSCDDGNPNTQDSCDPKTGKCVHVNVSCGDATPCMTYTVDPSTGTCVGTPVNCDDNNACTSDACNPATGACVHTAINCDDGNACTTDACDSTTGKCAHTPLGCDDGNTCTVDSCDPVKGCVYAAMPAGTACDDGNACTTGDACQGTVCKGTPASCDDGVACTLDSCDPTKGCIHTMQQPCACNSKNDCNDGNTATCDCCCSLGGGGQKQCYNVMLPNQLQCNCGQLPGCN